MSSTLGIGTYNDKTTFFPGEELGGKAMWITEKTPDTIELRLFWYTEGKGTQDVTVVDTQVIESPDSRGETEFTFILPADPYSFSGSLVSLAWALEIVVLPGKDAARCEISISPTGEEIDLCSEGLHGEDCEDDESEA